MPELIDRQAALKKMCETCGYCERFEKAMRSTHPDFVTDKCNAYKFLADQPTIEAEPVRRGHWVLTRDEQYEYCHCSECGYDTGENWMIGSEIPYCSQCGSKNYDGGADNEHQV